MTKARSYLSGTLLWIDDNFGNADFLEKRQAQDIDYWREIFGSIDSRLYRLLRLNLELVATHRDALEVLEEYEDEGKSSCFLTAIVDLRIPRSVESFTHPELKYGINLAKKLQSDNINFCFLSSSSSSVSEVLAQERLETIPYYQKQNDESGSLIPESLAQSILNEFRNKINWIDLKPLADLLDEQTSIFGQFQSTDNDEFANRVDAKEFSLRYFPFFGAFRDFVERWEYRHGTSSWQSLVMRAPVSHSNAFLTQCALMMLHPSLRRRQNQVQLHYFDLDKKAPSLEQLERDPVVRNMRNICIFRIHASDRCSLLPRDLAKLMQARRSGLSIFILPADDTADEYLDVVPNLKNVQFDDFPNIRRNDSVARSDLIHRSSEFVFQQCTIYMGETQEGEKTRRHLSSVYSRNPELLVHPVNWSFLMEAEEVNDEISDPYEILDVFSEVASMLDELSVEDKERVIHGRPLATDKLLKVADVAHKKCEGSHEKWICDALNKWLSQSWHVPYGLTEVYGDGEDEELKQEWENHSLRVLIDLASKWDVSSDVFDNPTPVQQDLLAAKNFLAHPAVGSILEGDLAGEAWDGLETLRWPHTRYPMPIALSRRLKEEGRFLWVQSDFLDQTMALRSGRTLYQDLDSMANQYQMRLRWMEDVADKLPHGWSEPVLAIRKAITDPNLPMQWSSNRDLRSSVWMPLFALLSNALPISLLYHHLISGRKVSSGNSSARVRLMKSKGFGSILSPLRGIREELDDAGIRPSDILQEPWRCHIENIAKLSSYYVELPGQYQAALEDAQKGGKKLEPFPDIQIESLLWDLIINLAEDETIKNDGRFTTSEALKSMFNLSNQHNLKSADWFIPAELRPDIKELPYKVIPSLLASRGDYIWSYLDMMSSFQTVLRPLRFFDGYHLLSAIGDIRNSYKGKPPSADFEYSNIERVLELALWGLEGLVAQLKFCLEQAGHRKVSSPIPLTSVDLTAETEFEMSVRDEIEEIMKVERDEKGGYKVYVLGIHGAATAGKYAYQDISGEVHQWEESPQLKMQDNNAAQ